MFCDGPECLDWTDGGHTVREARAAALKAGWVRRRHSTNGKMQDLCPRCAQSRACGGPGLRADP